MTIKLVMLKISRSPRLEDFLITCFDWFDLTAFILDKVSPFQTNLEFEHVEFLYRKFSYTMKHSIAFVK